MPRLRAILVSQVCLVLATAQSTDELLVRKYQKAKHDELIATGQRHVDLGWAIKDKGLIPQATYQFVLAVELSERIAECRLLLDLVDDLFVTDQQSEIRRL